MHANKQQIASSGIRIAVDIGSTMVKIAQIGANNKLLSQEFYPRDFEAGIARQVESLLGQLDLKSDEKDILICSSANGGLRVGISCLTKHFSGAELQNQVLLAGANPIFVHDFEEQGSNATFVDILLVGGGIDCEDATLLEERLRRFKLENYHFGSLFYAGNSYLAGLFIDRFPQVIVIPNPLAEGLRSKTNSVFEWVRRAYLDDLVYKEGISELGSKLSSSIRPTPEVVSRGFQRAVFNRSSIEIMGPCILVDIGGATTDIHYTVEIIRDDSDEKSSAASSIARYVFTDLGIVASRDTALQQMRNHPRIYDFLSRVLDEDAREAYRLLREGEYYSSPELLSYGCLFLSLDRFAQGRGPGLPMANLGKVGQIILTGGAAQSLDVKVVARVMDMLLADGGSNPRIMIDKHYQLWIDGITWSDPAPF